MTPVGLSAKNAILIIAFCVALRRQGKPFRQAVVEAARLRFRPIIMTSLAFILGVLTLVIARGRAQRAGTASARSDERGARRKRPERFLRRCTLDDGNGPRCHD